MIITCSVCPYLQTCPAPACMHHPKDDPVYAGRVGYIDWVHMKIQWLFIIFSVATLQAECFHRNLNFAVSVIANHQI